MYNPKVQTQTTFFFGKLNTSNFRTTDNIATNIIRRQMIDKVKERFHVGVMTVSVHRANHVMGIGASFSN